MNTLIICGIVLIIGAFLLFVYRRYAESFHIPGARSSGFFDYFFSQNPNLYYEKICFKAAEGKSLGGLQLIPDCPAKGLIVLTHGYNRTIENYLPEAKLFVNAGFQVIMFDGVGVGLSGGNSIVGLTQHVLDMKTVLDQIIEDPQLAQLPLFLYGHSWGGYAANAVSCIREYPIRGIISVAAFNDALTTLRSVIRRRYGWLSGLVLPVVRFFLFCSFGRLSTYTSAKGLSKTNCPVLIYHSYDDAVVSFDDSFEKMRTELQGRSNIQFMKCNGRNHNITTPPAVDKELLLLQKEVSKFSAPDEATLDRLWALQIQTDEELVNTFIEFYEESLR